METLLKSKVLKSYKIANFLEENKIKKGETIKENKEIFIDYVLTKYQTKIKTRARIRRKLMMNQ